MAVTQISYARLYNTGNYENIRFEVVVSVEDNGNVATAAAFEEAKVAVHAAYAQWMADRETEAAQRLQEREAARAAKQKTAGDLF